MNKELLRNKYLKIRENINNKIELDNQIFNSIINLKEYKNCTLLLTYVSLQMEVDTIKLIEYSLSHGKSVAVPKCEENNIVFYNINSLEDLEKGSFNILEPKTNNVLKDFSNSICIVPGIAFDKYNNRIGYGKGYYDRFLQNYKGKKIGLCYDKCICEKIDVDKYDIKMDMIIHF